MRCMQAISQHVQHPSHHMDKGSCSAIVLAPAAEAADAFTAAEALM